MVEKEVSEFIDEVRELENITVRVRDDEEVEITVEESDYEQLKEARSMLPEDKSLRPVDGAIASKLFFLRSK